MALPSKLFCDTSFFYACMDPADANHSRAEVLVAEAAGDACAFYATWDIISETVTLLRYRRSYQAALAFLADVKPELRVLSYGNPVRDEAEKVFRRYGRDHRLSFCDAISFVVVTALLDNMSCLAFDQDFRKLVGLTVLA